MILTTYTHTHIVVHTYSHCHIHKWSAVLVQARGMTWGEALTVNSLWDDSDAWEPNSFCWNHWGSLPPFMLLHTFPLMRGTHQSNSTQWWITNCFPIIDVLTVAWQAGDCVLYLLCHSLKSPIFMLQIHTISSSSFPLFSDVAATGYGE